MDYFNKALAIRLESQDHKHPSVGKTYAYIGGMYARRLKYSKAIEYFEKALETDIRASSAVGGLYCDIGLAYKENGRYAKAMTYFDDALRAKLQMLGPEHIEVSKMHRIIGHTLYLRGRYRAAYDSVNKAVKISENCLGRFHSNTRKLKKFRTAIKKRIR